MVCGDQLWPVRGDYWREASILQVASVGDAIKSFSRYSISGLGAARRVVAIGY